MRAEYLIVGAVALVAYLYFHNQKPVVIESGSKTSSTTGGQQSSQPSNLFADLANGFTTIINAGIKIANTATERN